MAARADCPTEPDASSWCEPDTPTVIMAEVMPGFDREPDALVSLDVWAVYGAPIDGVEADAQIELAADGHALAESGVTVGSRARALLLADDTGRAVGGRVITGGRVAIDSGFPADTVTHELARDAALSDEHECLRSIRAANGWRASSGCDDIYEATCGHTGRELCGALGVAALLARRARSRGR
jgi:hypothetical protein